MGRIFSKLLFSILLPLTVCAAVVGIDIGYGSIKAAIIQSGRKPVMLLNESASRSSPSALYLNRIPRAVGTAAQTFQTRDPMGVVVLFHRLLGKDCAAEDSSLDLLPFKAFSYDISCDEETSSYKLRINRNGEVDIFPEEYLAYFLEYYKELAIKHIDNESSSPSMAAAAKRNLEFSFSVPWGLTQRERAAYQTASNIAGVKLKILYPQVVSAAGYHSIDMRKNVSTDVGSNKVIVDAGSLDTVACLVHYKKSSSTVVVKRCNKAINNGGLYVDLALLDVILAKYERHSGEIPDSRRNRMVRTLLTNINKAKHMLSVNKSTTIRMENADGRGNNLTETITRTELEDIINELDISGTTTAVIASVMPKYTHYVSDNPNIKLLDDMSDNTDSDTETIDSIELIGGAWRVPVIQRAIIESFPNIPLATTINPDEAPALGAAFALATSRSYLKVPPLRIDDNSCPYVYSYKFSDGTREKTKELIRRKSWYQFKKFLKTRTAQPKVWVEFIENDIPFTVFECDTEKALQEYNERVKRVEANIAQYRDQYLAENPLVKAPENEFELNFQYELNFGDLGLPIVRKPKISWEYEFLKPVVSTTTTTTTPYTITSDIGPTESTDATTTSMSTEDTTIEEESTTTGLDDGSTAVEEDQTDKTEKEVTKIVKLMKGKRELDVGCVAKDLSVPAVVSDELLEKIEHHFSKILQEDMAKVEHEHEKNTYESFLYGMKNMMYEDEVIEFYGQESVDVMEAKLIEFIDGFESDGYSRESAALAEESINIMLKDYLDSKTTSTTTTSTPTTIMENTTVISLMDEDVLSTDDNTSAEGTKPTIDKGEL